LDRHKIVLVYIPNPGLISTSELKRRLMGEWI
jgi:hypothetical protein